jgi:GNAT superfamily N-acetyltransferase
MPITLHIAAAEDVPAIVALRNAANDRLTEQYGQGFWSGTATENGVRFAMKTATVYVARAEDRRVIATLALATKKPWAIDKTYFHPSKRPLYLTSMAVAPDMQRTGVGRNCLADVRRIAAAWPADAIRLDAYDAPAGAGGFYAKCGFDEVGRVVYRGCPLVYFEMLL